MWKLKLASTVGGGGASSFLPDGDKFVYWARYIGLIAGAAYIGLGLLKTILLGWIFGPIVIACGIPILILELPLKFLMARLYLSFFLNYYFRAILYAVFAVLAFAGGIITFAAGLVLVGSAGAYLMAAFKGKSGKPVEDGDTGKAGKTAEPAKKDKDKSKSLASQAAAEGVV